MTLLFYLYNFFFNGQDMLIEQSDNDNLGRKSIKELETAMRVLRQIHWKRNSRIYWWVWFI